MRAAVCNQHMTMHSMKTLHDCRQWQQATCWCNLTKDPPQMAMPEMQMSDLRSSSCPQSRLHIVVMGVGQKMVQADEASTTSLAFLLYSLPGWPAAIQFMKLAVFRRPSSVVMSPLSARRRFLPVASRSRNHCTTDILTLKAAKAEVQLTSACHLLNLQSSAGMHCPRSIIQSGASALIRMLKTLGSLTSSTAVMPTHKMSSAH